MVSGKPVWWYYGDRFSPSWVEMRKETVILQALSLHLDKIADVEFTHELEHSHWPVVLRNGALHAGKTGFLTFRGRGGEKKILEPKNSNFLLTKQRRESVYATCCVTFMSLWRTCLRRGKWLEARKTTIETIKNKRLDHKFKVAVIIHAVRGENNSWVKN